MAKHFRALHFVLWTVNFALCIGLVYLMFTTKWFINNSVLSFAQSQGDTYWKGFFAECRTDYAVGGYACDNFQFPWFLMDGAVLGCRILLVLGWIMMTVALGVNVIIGNWNSTVRGARPLFYHFNIHTLTSSSSPELSYPIFSNFSTKKSERTPRTKLPSQV